jgi:GT2 family glycosyltransferase
MKIAIITPAINLWNKYTKPCIESIKTKYPYEIFLIDNASTDETKVEAEKMLSGEFTYIRNEERFGCAKSWNQGIKEAMEIGCDYFLVLNNDVLMHSEAIDRLVERFEKAKDQKENIAMVTCCNVRGELQDGHSIEEISPDTRGGINEAENPDFSAFMVSKESYNKIGLFDEEFEPCYYEDNSYHYRINLAGMKAICLPTALFYHFGSRTQNEAIPGQVICSSPAFERNKAEYVKMWGGLPEHEIYKTKYNK